MFERKAHKAYNFNSFEEFCDVVLVMGSSKSVISQMIGWARVERNLFGTRFDLNIVDKQVDESLVMTKLLDSAEAPKSITQRIYNELSRLNDAPDLQKRAFDEFKSVAAANVGTFAQQETQLSRIVDRIKRNSEPAPAVLETPTAPPTPAPTHKTVANPAPSVTATKEEEDLFADEEETPTQVHTPKPVVTSFVPELDSEVVTEQTFRRWEEALNTALTWVENESIIGTPRDCKEVQNALQEVAKWVCR
jgi:hypothetical protein